VSNFNQPICERCWINRNGLCVPVTIKIEFRVDAPFERCSYCGEPTFIGAWVRDNPKVVPYPHIEKEEENG
jgi:hypothetical protein